MKHTKLLLIAAAVFAAAAAQAQPRSFVSDDQAGATVMDGGQPHYIRLGTESSSWYGNRASVHIAYSNLPTYKGKRLYRTHKNSTSSARFDEIGRLPPIRRLFDGVVNHDDNDVTVTRLYHMYSPIYRYVPGEVPNDYPNLDRISFVRVGNADVYFNDWVGMQPGTATRTAGTNYSMFYSGTGKIAEMPTGGTTVYSVKGINHYVDTDTALPIGDLKADFAKKRLNGTIKRPGLSATADSAIINTTNASFSGRATANDVSGMTHGNSYGNDTAALAGIARFIRDPNLNTAFGGAKKQQLKTRMNVCRPASKAA